MEMKRGNVPPQMEFIEINQFFFPDSLRFQFKNLKEMKRGNVSPQMEFIAIIQFFFLQAVCMFQKMLLKLTLTLMCTVSKRGKTI